MLSQVKKLSEGLNRFNIVLLSLLAGLLSTKFQQYGSLIQFLAVSTVILAILVVIDFLFNDSRHIESLLALSFISLLFLTGYRGVIISAVALSIISIFYIPLPFSKINSRYLTAFLAHIGDLVTTYVAVPGRGEANPFMVQIIDFVGLLPALVIMKLGVISIVLMYSYNQINGFQEEVLIKSITVLGLAVTARNIILLL